MSDVPTMIEPHVRPATGIEWGASGARKTTIEVVPMRSKKIDDIFKEAFTGDMVKILHGEHLYRIALNEKWEVEKEGFPEDVRYVWYLLAAIHQALTETQKEFQRLAVSHERLLEAVKHLTDLAEDDLGKDVTQIRAVIEEAEKL